MERMTDTPPREERVMPSVQEPASAHTPLLITGTHRSGTTWVGRVLAASPSVGYIHEPFNVERTLGITRQPVPKWYTHICNENEDGYLESMRDCFAFRYQLGVGIQRLRSWRDVGRLIQNASQFARYRWQRRRPLMKDPLALFSAEWLADRLGVQVVVMIRHPAAFVGSLVKAGWDFPFEDLTSQPLLMQNLLSDFGEELEGLAGRRSLCRIEQGIMLWRLTHYVIRHYRTTQPTWRFVRHEDLSRDPQRAFSSLATSIGLPFDSEVQARLRQLSFNSKVATANTKDLRIDSAANVHSWKKRLSAGEIEQIRDGTQDIWPDFYSDEDWE